MVVEGYVLGHIGNVLDERTVNGDFDITFQCKAEQRVGALG